MSSEKVAEGFDIVVRRAALTHLYCCVSRSEAILSHVLALCHAPGTKTNVACETWELMRRGDKYWNKGAETKQSGAAEGRIPSL
jgi:hypothetical protein